MKKGLNEIYSDINYKKIIFKKEIHLVNSEHDFPIPCELSIDT